MSMSDPIADMLTRIRNAQHTRKLSVVMYSSRVKQAISHVLKSEGYIEDFSVRNEMGKSFLEIKLKYHHGKPVIDVLKRISKPGLRTYVGSRNIPRVMNGLGVAILSTSNGLMTDRQAKLSGIGGEVICIVA